MMISAIIPFWFICTYKSIADQQNLIIEEKVQASREFDILYALCLLLVFDSSYLILRKHYKALMCYMYLLTHIFRMEKIKEAHKSTYSLHID